MKTLSQEEVARRMRAFEDETNIFNLRLGTIPIWQVLRSSVAYTVQKLPLEKPRLPRALLWSAWLQGLAPWSLLALGPARYVAYGFYSGFRLLENGKYEDVWYDVLLSKVPGGRKLVRINAAGYEKRLNRAHFRPNYNVSFFAPVAGLLARLFPYQKNHPHYAEVARLSESLLGNEALTAIDVQKTFSIFIWTSRLHQLLLKVLRAKNCVVVDSGEYPVMLACQKLKLPFIELQHGIFTRNDPHVLPGGKGRDFLLPTKIGVYGDFWKEELQGTLQYELGVVEVVGNGILEKYRMRRQAHARAVATKPTFVMTTQGLDHDNLVEFIGEALTLTQESFDFIFKLHPAFDDKVEVYERLAQRDSRVSYRKGTEDPNTYELLARSHAHLSIASACHYDALSIGTPTVVLKLGGHEIMLDLIKSRRAQFASTPQELAVLLESYCRGEFPLLPDKEQLMFCADNFPQRMDALLC